MEIFVKNSKELSKKNIIKNEKLVGQYINWLKELKKSKSYEEPESFISAIFDNNYQDEIVRLAKKKSSKKLKYIFIVGIGGSSLGVQAIYEALRCKIGCDKFPKMIFLDTIDPDYFENIKNLIRKKITKQEEILLIVISKSGTTTETAVNFETISNILNKKLGNIEERTVFITDENSKLWERGTVNNSSVVIIPKSIGGRYSVFSAVGIFPLACLGINIVKLLKGAQRGYEISLENNYKKNPALLGAFLLYVHYQEGVKINDNFFFTPQLEFLGKWYRQLMGESIGKEEDLNGKKISTGITPTVSIGTNDLHSMVQLYLAGPRDKFTNFVYVLKNNWNVDVPRGVENECLVDGIYGKNFKKILEAIYNGVVSAYQKRKLPFMETIIPEVSEYYLGQYMQIKMMEIIFLAKLMNINAFDQPSVEEYKKITRKILSK